jgi:hypothetical protein
MTWPRYEAMCKEWERTPPLNVSVHLIAQSLGAASAPAAKPPPPKPGKQAAPAAAAEDPERVRARQEMFEALGASGFATKKPDWLKKAGDGR